MRSVPAGGATFASGAVSGSTILLGLLVADRLAREGRIPHKDLWPLSIRDVVGLVLAALSLFVAAGGGIGEWCSGISKVHHATITLRRRMLTSLHTIQHGQLSRVELLQLYTSCIAKLPCIQAV